ncbi:ParA family protein (plasmid) [Bradyrhizobium septentrionale]|uniref:ParA family protein n=1 Tax=Bradyrhizobium septentrionale TaxID=1404411 RepID=UPI001CCDA921|nr:ParA family protein [Bradyrhizobium septentrionale]UGY20896.1 ParA family protein [Bradyrhizobium septentrionale]UGY20906.1 ParA family protein [Bradyrhizobium septentrionale]
MNVISFVNQKGGTGKSMLAINLAVAAQESGENVCLIDLDPQGTIVNWYDTRTAETPNVVNHEQMPNLTEALERLGQGGFTLVIIDTKGEDSHATRGAMLAADLCLIPIRPAGPDLHASRPTMEALRSMKRDFALIINQATPNKAAKITAAIMASLAHDGPVVPQAVAARMDHQYAYALGQGASEYEPGGKAAEEIKELWAWCRKRLGKQQGDATSEQAKRRA